MLEKIEKSFQVQGENFLFIVNKDNEILFGHYVFDPFNWDRNETLTTELNKFKHGIKVFNCVTKLLKKWVYTERPHYFYFSVYDSNKRVKPYLRTSKRLAKELGYQLLEDNQIFHFYKYKDFQLNQL